MGGQPPAIVLASSRGVAPRTFQRQWGGEVEAVSFAVEASLEWQWGDEVSEFVSCSGFLVSPVSSWKCHLATSAVETSWAFRYKCGWTCMCTGEFWCSRRGPMWRLRFTSGPRAQRLHLLAEPQVATAPVSNCCRNSRLP